MPESDSSVTFVPKQHSSLSFDSKIVDEYVLKETLGQGSCAIVKLGVHRVTGEHVAVKIVRPSTMQKQKEVLREVEALRVLKNHPHIIKMHKVIKENGFVCIILELGTGGELFNYILDNGRLSEDHARHIFRQILSGVQYCHAHLIVHRDLKPENIILDKNGDVKITDFGLSNFLRPNTLFSTFCGSPIYTPPEIVLHRKYNGALSDVWSLGVILFVMVTGGMPWRLENNKVQNLEQLLIAQFKLPDSLGLSEECKSLIRCMLTAESHTRASIETIVKHPWVCKGYAGPPDAYLKPQPTVGLGELDYHLVKQLSLLAMDVPTACHAIQNDPKSPALHAYRSMLSKQGKVQQVTEEMTVLGTVPAEPISPSRTRARSDPAADRLKMEKTRLEKVKQENDAEVVHEKEKIREKIRKWKALHKEQLSTKNSAVVHQTNTVVYAEQQQQQNDKSRVEKFKNFLTYFRRSNNNSGITTTTTTGNASGAGLSQTTIRVMSPKDHHLPLRQNHSPLVTRR